MKSGLIECNPAVMVGKPTFKGTRLTVEFVLERLSAGDSEADLLKEHPRLKKEHIQAALAYAAEVLRNEPIYPLSQVSSQ